MDDQTSMTGGHKALEDGGKLLGYLLERALDLLVLDMVEMGDELFDGFLRRVEFLSPLEKLVLLCCEVVVLLKGLLVDVLVLLEGGVDLFESGLDLWGTLAPIA